MTERHDEKNEGQAQCEPEEECPWCNSTGDIKKTNRIYWGAVLAIVVFLFVLYLFAVRH